jgi:excisionase family DNA binding protein
MSSVPSRAASRARSIASATARRSPGYRCAYVRKKIAGSGAECSPGGPSAPARPTDPFRAFGPRISAPRSPRWHGESEEFLYLIKPPIPSAAVGRTHPIDHLASNRSTMTSLKHVPSDRNDRLVYTVDEADHLLGISRAFAYELVARGELPVIRLGRRVLVPKLRLLALVDLPATDDETSPHQVTPIEWIIPTCALLRTRLQSSSPRSSVGAE